MKLRAVRGMNDILPNEVHLWQRLEQTFRQVVGLYGYQEIRTPLIEDTALFVKQIGEGTDVVDKEMYSFDRHGDKLTVRPEGTAGAARAYVEHAIANKEPVSRWYYLGPMFRGERPAKGRYRQFYQAGCELYGDPGPVCDAEMIELCVRLLHSLGITTTEVLVNSLGGEGTRERYRSVLLDYLRPHADKLSEDSQRRLEKNPLRVLDSKSATDQAIVADAPSILEVLAPEDVAHFDAVKRSLDALGVAYTVEPRLVRGLDYYTRTLFEIKAPAADLGAQSTVCGGGRYDNMVQGLGGPSVPAIGFAMGLERLLVAMSAPVEQPAGPDVYVAVLAAEGTPTGLALARELRDRGLSVNVDARESKVKTMLRRADASGASYCVLLGESELNREALTLKHLAAHSQQEIPFMGAADAITRLVRGGHP